MVCTSTPSQHFQHSGTAGKERCAAQVRPLFSWALRRAPGFALTALASTCAGQTQQLCNSTQASNSSLRSNHRCATKKQTRALRPQIRRNCKLQHKPASGQGSFVLPRPWMPEQRKHVVHGACTFATSQRRKSSWLRTPEGPKAYRDVDIAALTGSAACCAAWLVRPPHTRIFAPFHVLQLLPYSAPVCAPAWPQNRARQVLLFPTSIKRLREQRCTALQDILRSSWRPQLHKGLLTSVEHFKY